MFKAVVIPCGITIILTMIIFPWVNTSYFIMAAYYDAVGNKNQQIKYLQRLEGVTSARSALHELAVKRRADALFMCILRSHVKGDQPQIEGYEKDLTWMINNLVASKKPIGLYLHLLYAPKRTIYQRLVSMSRVDALAAAALIDIYWQSGWLHGMDMTLREARMRFPEALEPLAVYCSKIAICGDANYARELMAKHEARFMDRADYWLMRAFIEVIDREAGAAQYALWRCIEIEPSNAIAHRLVRALSETGVDSAFTEPALSSLLHRQPKVYPLRRAFFHLLALDGIAVSADEEMLPISSLINRW